MNFPRLLALAAIGLVGTLGSAKADLIISDSVQIWSGDTPGATSSSSTQQGLPSAQAGLTLITSGPSTFVAPINYNLLSGGSDTIGGFFGSNSPVAPTPANCNAACLSTTLSLGDFSHVSLFEFTFTLVNPSDLTFLHDDGISLFVHGDTTTNLIPGVSSPTTAELTTINNVGPGQYDLWYSASNGLPEVLQASAVAVPGPIAGAGLPGLIAACGGLIALARRRRNKAA